ncbi:MAG TPA: D-aminoacyl-tRNA deacylase [Vicinamibacterales bacterium]|nr:D-aminoacyl-tRNA deacylase [Vicinamibacterales bacterium]
MYVVSGCSRTCADVRAVIQRVSSASVAAGAHTAAIGPGLLALVGVERGDGPADADYIARKIRELRLFPDGNKAFDRSVEEIGGRVMVVSQFTLAADCRKGRRPSFDAAAPPDEARPLYDAVVRALEDAGLDVATGVFQADMQVSLVNDGPVTVILDSRRTL